MCIAKNKRALQQCNIAGKSTMLIEMREREGERGREKERDAILNYWRQTNNDPYVLMQFVLRRLSKTNSL